MITSNVQVPDHAGGLVVRHGDHGAHPAGPGRLTVRAQGAGEGQARQGGALRHTQYVFGD